MIILVMGVSGVGKSTIGHALAQQLGWQFVDADDFHPAANVAKMRAGIPLTDADRAPWLQSLRTSIDGLLAASQPAVLACSALKRAYREQLVTGPEVKLVFLRADFGVIAERMAARQGHYMNPKLLESQFADLEAPHDALSLDAGRPVPEIVAGIRASFGI